MAEQQAAGQEGAIFRIERIYMSNSSFEAPLVPEIFRQEWKPEVNVDLQTKTNRLEDTIFDVVLHITVTVKMGEKVAFLVEVHQAGIFTVSGFPVDQLSHALGSLCPAILYPYAREAISDLVVRGGFPQLLLAPVNFDALYMQHLEHQKTAQDASAEQQKEGTTN